MTIFQAKEGPKETEIALDWQTDGHARTPKIYLL